MGKKGNKPYTLFPLKPAQKQTTTYEGTSDKYLQKYRRIFSLTQQSLFWYYIIHNLLLHSMKEHKYKFIDCGVI